MFEFIGQVSITPIAKTKSKFLSVGPLRRAKPGQYIIASRAMAADHERGGLVPRDTIVTGRT